MSNGCSLGGDRRVHSIGRLLATPICSDRLSFAIPIPRSAESIARGRQLFAKNCAVCHGAEGRGDGAAAPALPQRPEDLSRIAPPPIFPDGVVAYRIINGVKMMPAFKSTLSENEIWDLLNFIRSLATR